MALRALGGQRLRSLLSMLAIGIGVAAVILLTSIGEGARRYVVQEFTQFGTNLLAVTPGKSETIGIPGVTGGSTRKLTIDDALALERLAVVEDAMPVALGQARVEAGERGRSVYVYGATGALPDVWKFGVRQGSFLPRGDPRRGTLVAVLGPKLKRELFGEESALGEFVRIAGTRLRVVGVMEPKGQMLGFDLDDAAYVPVRTAMRMFNLEELYEIEVMFAAGTPAARVEEEVRALLMQRHGGNDDFTIVTQTEMLAVFGKVMDVVTLAVGAIAGISLFVGAIGILTVMWITVGERTSEIGLARAIGATRRQIHRLFLVEASCLAGIGGALGLAIGNGLAGLLRLLVPGLPVHVPFAYVAAGLACSVVTGLVSGLLPARRAAHLDPIEALRAE
jgi:putative ABC transport system permease protein